MTSNHSSSLLPFFLSEVPPYRVKGCCYAKNGEELLEHGPEHDFSTELLAWAIQQPSVSLPSIETYLKKYDNSTLMDKLRVSCKGIWPSDFYPILYFAVERNLPKLVNLLCTAGANPRDRVQPSGIPVLAYCVISAEYRVTDTTDSLIALLAASANPTDVPEDMWEEYIKAPKTTKASTSTDLAKTSKKKVNENWCTSEIRKALCRTLTLLQRYCLWKASHLKAATEVTKQVVEMYDIRELFQIHYHIIGQFPAAQQVINNITSRLLMASRRPLVLLFTGPSGHGKTELACRIGDLLSLDTHNVDCTEMRHETDIFGPKFPYHGWKDGSPLNNFLAEHTGYRSVIFLDEFDKTQEEVRNAMLIIFGSGSYNDRRSGKQLDCSNTIWILATNLGQEQIKKFWDRYLNDAPEERQISAPFHILQAQLKSAFIGEFGAPLTGRISCIIPFLPFTSNQQAVVAYTFMRTLRNVVRGRIDIAAGKLVRHVHLNFIDDSQIAQYISNHDYVTELGARSLDNGVIDQVENRLTSEFLKGEERITDAADEKWLTRYDVRVIDGEDKLQEVEVKKAGTTVLQCHEVDSWNVG